MASTAGPAPAARRNSLPPGYPSRHSTRKPHQQSPLPWTQNPPAPNNPPAPGFPRLRETFKSGLGSRHVLLIRSGRSTPVLSRTICSAPRPTAGQGRRTRCLHGDTVPGDTQPKAASRDQQCPREAQNCASPSLDGSRSGLSLGCP